MGVNTLLQSMYGTHFQSSSIKMGFIASSEFREYSGYSSALFSEEYRSSGKRPEYKMALCSPRCRLVT